MPVYIYKAKAGPQKIKEGVITADSRDAVIERLSRDGYFPIYIKENTKSGAHISKKKLHVSARDIGIFTRQLADLLEGGLTLYQALDTLVKQTENKSFSYLILEIRDQIGEGNSLSNIFQKYPRVFSPLYVSMVSSGETSGMLDKVLIRLAEFSEKEQELYFKIKSALMYPLFLASFGTITVILLVIFIVPKLTAVFSDFGQDLPLPTKCLVGVSHFVIHWWWLILLILGAIIFFIRQRQRSAEGKFIIDKWKLNAPVIGKFLLTGELAKFSRTLSVLLESGVPILKSMDIVIRVAGNEVIRRDLSNVRIAISKGASLGSSLEDISYFPALMTNMIKVGEKSGMVEKVLIKVAGTYDREIDRAAKVFTTLLEPVLILVMGIIVGFIVISMLLPIFSIDMAIK